MDTVMDEFSDTPEAAKERWKREMGQDPESRMLRALEKIATNAHYLGELTRLEQIRQTIRDKANNKIPLWFIELFLFLIFVMLWLIWQEMEK
jgi:type VI protein secretion system component VasF